MSNFIGIESLAANALIEILEKTDRRSVDFETLFKYGMKVVKVFQEQTGEEAILLISRKYQLSMIENYSDFFDIEFHGPGQGVFKLKETITLEKLSKYFRWTMSLKIINAFIAKEAIRELGVAM